MKRSVMLAAAALSAASAAEARVGPVPPRMDEPMHLPRHGAPDVPGDCTLRVAFSSFGAGIDGAALTRMERRLRADRRVRNFTRHPWGREGELTLCIRLIRLRDVYGVGRELSALVPARPRGPIQVQYPRRMPAPH